MARGIEQDNIRRLLRQSGVPDWVIPTTLQKEKQMPLREFYQTAAYLSGDGLWRGVYVHPGRPGADAQARKVFFLAAKEAALLGLQVYVLSLTRLVMALCDDPDGHTNDGAAIDTVKTLWVTGFYEHGVPFPLSPWQAARLRSWVLERYESGNSISWLADKPLSETSPWWNGAFIGMLQGHTVTFSVEGK